MILAMSKANNEGRQACYSGVPLNTNPYLYKKGVCNMIMRRSWEKGFRAVESEIRGC